MNPATPDFTDDMAAQAAAVFFGHPQPGSANAFRDALNVFAPLVAANEREACAKIADKYAADGWGFTELEAAGEKIAASIRARSAKEASQKYMTAHQPTS